MVSGEPGISRLVFVQARLYPNFYARREVLTMTLDDLLDLSVGDDRIDIDISKPRRQEDPSYEMAPYNPMMSRPMQTWDDRTMDRMLTIKRPIAISGEMWITESGFAETLSLLPLNKMEQRMFWRKFRRIQMLASGELNKRIMDSRQERLALELISQKSRLDVVEGGNLNERLAWITNKQMIEQTLRTPPPQRAKGFIGSVVDGLTGR